MPETKSVGRDKTLRRVARRTVAAIAGRHGNRVRETAQLCDANQDAIRPTIVDGAMTLTSLTLGNSNNLHVTLR